MGKWLTPDNPITPPPNATRIITAPDTMIGFVSGALSLLARVENWEQLGTMSPDDAAAIFEQVYDDYINS